MTHAQLLGALLKSNGLVSQGDMAKLDWFIKKFKKLKSLLTSFQNFILTQ
jgi:hypothetical protein